MTFDLSVLVQELDALSAFAVIAGVIFVAFQLRQNAKLISASDQQIEMANRQVEASILQNRQQVILYTVDRFTDDAFNAKRTRAYEIVKNYRENNWIGYLESPDDYEVRGFIAHFESTGYLAKIGIVDVRMMQEAMGVVVYDWAALDPAVKYYRETWKRQAYVNFEWLKDEVKKAMEHPGQDGRTAPSEVERPSTAP